MKQKNCIVSGDTVRCALGYTSYRLFAVRELFDIYNVSTNLVKGAADFMAKVPDEFVSRYLATTVAKAYSNYYYVSKSALKTVGQVSAHRFELKTCIDITVGFSVSCRTVTQMSFYKLAALTLADADPSMTLDILCQRMKILMYVLYAPAKRLNRCISVVRDLNGTASIFEVKSIDDIIGSIRDIEFCRYRGHYNRSTFDYITCAVILLSARYGPGAIDYAKNNIGKINERVFAAVRSAPMLQAHPELGRYLQIDNISITSTGVMDYYLTARS